MATRGLTIVRGAFIELGVLPPDQVLGPDTAAWGLEKLNRLIDRWKTRKLFVVYYNKLELVIGVTKQSYTIGKSGAADFDYDRPISLDDRADLILTSATPNPVTPLRVVNIDGYKEIPTPTLQSTQPTTIYYQATVPDGTFWLWPVPTQVANKIRLFNRAYLNGWYTAGVADLYADVDLAPGYEDAITWNLAASLLATYPNAGSPETIRDEAKKSLSAIIGPNSMMPLQPTEDSGMPNGGRDSGAWFNYLDGEII